MKQLFVLFGALFFTGSVGAQSISDAICQAHAGTMSVIISWRQAEIPIGTAEDVWNSENDVRTRVFLKQVTREIYKNPSAGKQYLESGRFVAACIKTHRGY